VLFRHLDSSFPKSLVRYFFYAEILLLKPHAPFSATLSVTLLTTDSDLSNSLGQFYLPIPSPGERRALVPPDLHLEVVP
jgi:hypothetical protein